MGRSTQILPGIKTVFDFSVVVMKGEFETLKE